MTQTDRYRTPKDMSTEIPVFPLQGCILLPRATLPLNVFEPRYLKMIDDVVSSHRLVGIVQPAAAAGARESPAGKSVPLRAIGCAGRLTAFEELADGRLAIVLTGVCRFEIEDEISTMMPYRMVHASYHRFAHDLERGAGEGEIDRGALLATLKAYLQAKRLQADWGAVEDAGSELLVNALSIMSPYGAEEKQALLEAATLKERAAVLHALSQIELAAGPGGETRGRLQ